MSGRRRPPEPAIPVSRGDQGITTPQQMPFIPPPGVDVQDEQVLATSENVVMNQEQVPEPAAEEPEGVELSPEEQVMFASLLTCGRRTKTLKVLDHTVVVQTLNCDDDLRIGLFVKNYEGSIGDQRAYQVGVAAAGIRTIDGVPLVQTLFEAADEDALFEERVNKVKKMYPTVVQRIYRAVIDAEKEFVELVDKLGKSNG